MEALKARGYRCRLERVAYLGEVAGVPPAYYRVRRPDGSLAVHGVSRHRSAQAAWAEAAWVEEVREEHLAVAPEATREEE